MKAKEYVDKYFPDDLDIDNYEKMNVVIGGLYKSMYYEMRDIMKARHIRFDRGFHNVLYEQNDKWNAICRRLEEKFGVEVLNKDAFSELVMKGLEKE